MSVCQSPGRPRDVSLATEGLGCRRTPPLPRQGDGPDGERGIPDASGSDRGRPHSVPRKITSSFQSRSGEKTSRHLFDHKPERGPRPPLTSAGACGAPHRRPRPLFGGVKAMPKPRETRSKCQLCSASLPCAPDAMSSGRDETLADQDQTKKDPLPRMRLPSAAFEGARVGGGGGTGSVGGGWNWRRGGRTTASDWPSPILPFPDSSFFPPFPLGPSGPLASPHVLLRSSYPSLSVIGSVARSRRLARGSWLVDPLCFSLSLCLFDCRGCCIDESGARHGTTDRHTSKLWGIPPPDSIRRGPRWGPGLHRSDPVPLHPETNGQAAGERGGTPPAIM